MEGGKKRLASDTQDKTIINQIMLRFRPIAPKPTNSDGTVAGNSAPEKNRLVTKKRVKRKYVRVKKVKSSCLLKDNNDGGWLDGTVAMLQLLPETEVTDGKDFSILDPVDKLPCWINFNTISGDEGAISLVGPRDESDLLHDSDRTAAVIFPATKVVIESWITMESVTGTCEYGRRLGCTDEEKMKNLEVDTCPGFISNSLGRVDWVNPAYRRMVVPIGKEGGAPPEVVVSLVEKEKFLLQLPAFSCRVRVVNYCKEATERKTVQMTSPCDVWKMDFGGFAWRLDVEAALSLGRSNNSIT